MFIQNSLFIGLIAHSGEKLFLLKSLNQTIRCVIRMNALYLCFVSIQPTALGNNGGTFLKYRGYPHPQNLTLILQGRFA